MNEIAKAMRISVEIEHNKSWMSIPYAESNSNLPLPPPPSTKIPAQLGLSWKLHDHFNSISM